MTEILKIELFCPNCKKKIKAEIHSIRLEWNYLEIVKNCEHCNHEIEISYDTVAIEELINKNLIVRKKDLDPCIKK